MMVNPQERLDAYRRTIAIILVVVVCYLSFLILRPFLVAITGAAVLTYIFYPVYKFLAKNLPRPLPKESLAALLTLLLIIAIVILPMVVITALLTDEIKVGYVFIHDSMLNPSFNFDLPAVLTQNFNVDQIKQVTLNVASPLISWLQKIIKSIPGAFLGILITIFSVYYFLKGGANIYAFAQDFFPLPEGRYRQIFKRFDDLSRGYILGQIVVGLIQGLLAWLAYAYLAVPNPLLWAFVTALISIIPMLGASLVWLPIAAYLLIVGSATGLYWKSLAMFAYGFLLISSIDNIIKPKIIGDHAKIHPLVILFGILGGLQLFGLPGILIGPLVLTLFDVVINIFREAV